MSVVPAREDHCDDATPIVNGKPHADNGSFCQELPGTDIFRMKSTKALTVGDTSRLLGKMALTSTAGIVHSGRSRTSRPAFISGAHRYPDRQPMPAPFRTRRWIINGSFTARRGSASILTCTVSSPLLEKVHDLE